MIVVCQYSVIRGGGWFDRVLTCVRAADRDWGTRSFRLNDVGFRCAVLL